MFKNKARILTKILFILFTFQSAQTQNVFPSSGNVGIGTASPAYSLDVAGLFHTTFNSQTYPASSGLGGLGVSWNKSNGLAEVNFWNVYNSANTSFIFS